MPCALLAGALRLIAAYITICIRADAALPLSAVYAADA